MLEQKEQVLDNKENGQDVEIKVPYVNFDKELKEEIVIDNKKEDKPQGIIKGKVEAIKTGKFVTIIHGSYDKQEVTTGKILSFTEFAVTISDEINQGNPISLKYDTIIDIFEVKTTKKAKAEFSLYKLGKGLKEFFAGTEEERQHELKQKLAEKKLKDELKNRK